MSDQSSTKLFFGLGNPEPEYSFTRHNAGKLFIQDLNGMLSLRGPGMNRKIKGEKLNYFQNVDTYTYSETESYMNTSGKNLLTIMKFLELSPKNLFLVYDDLDLSLGEYKIQFGTTPKKHNGVNSVISNIGKQEFNSIRLGIDNRQPENRIPGDAYVLQKFPTEELKLLASTFQSIYKGIGLL